VPLLTETDDIRSILTQVAEIGAWYDAGHTLPMGGVETVEDVLGRARTGGMLLGEELFSVGSSLRAAARLSGTIVEAREDFPSLVELGEAIPDLSVLTRCLFSTFEPSGKIRDAASTDLSDLRRRQIGLRTRVKRQMEVYVASHELEPMLQDSYYTVREERFVLPVRSSEKPRFDGIIHGSSSTGQTVFIEPQEMIASNNELLLIDESIRREERRILRDRTERLSEVLPDVLQTMNAVVELDLLHARALLAASMNAVVPVVQDNGITRLVEARHPGLLLKGNEVVPNTFEIGDAWQLLIVTGPNTGGKTVTLSTLGLCTLMTQAGMPIPALPGSEVAVFPRMFTLFGDAQDLERDLSTFSGHLEGIVALLREAGPGALALIDEPIVGTEPNAGAAMAIAVLEHLAERGVRGAVSTHYDRLKTLSLEDSRFQNASVGMDPVTLQPNWELTIGTSGRSSPLEMAARLGMPAALVERAQEILGGGHGDLQRVLEALEDERSALEARKEESAAEAQKHRNRLAELELEGVRMAKASQAEALAEISQARKEIADAIRALQRAGDPAAIRRIERKVDRADRKARAAVGGAPVEAGPELPEGRRMARREEVKEGAAVWLLGMSKAGVVRTTPADYARVEIQVGALRLTRPLDDLAVDLQAPVSSRPARSALPSSPLEMLPSEIDLRGQRVDDALAALERALDEAMLAGRGAVRVIHGHGTGALRKAVRELFERSHYVSEWAPGGPDEGGDGVSVVTLGED